MAVLGTLAQHQLAGVDDDSELISGSEVLHIQTGVHERDRTVVGKYLLTRVCGH